MSQIQQQLVEIAASLSQLTSLQICHQLRFGGDHYFAFAATLLPALTADEWIWSYDASAKRDYAAGHGGALPLWWSQFSFVFPVWHHFSDLQQNQWASASTASPFALARRLC